MKIVTNRCFGGYGLSDKACKWLNVPTDNCTLFSKGGHNHAFDNDRTNPLLIACVEALGSDASGELAKLEITEIPDGIPCTLR